MTCVAFDTNPAAEGTLLSGSGPGSSPIMSALVPAMSMSFASLERSLMFDSAPPGAPGANSSQAGNPDASEDHFAGGAVGQRPDHDACGIGACDARDTAGGCRQLLQDRAAG